LRVVIVGCGGFARNYLPVYRSIPNLRVVACVDADLAAAQAMAATLGAETASSDLAVAVNAPADYAVVSTPNFLHVEQATALLGSGKHVLLQKHFTAQTMWLMRHVFTKESQRTHKRLTRRFVPPVIHLKHQVN
jgi:predicted dehydrogenase